MIVQDEKILRTPCEDAKPEEVGEIIALLEKELEHSARLGRPGIGLAAIQINIPKKIAIVRINNELKLDLVNAKIEKGYDQMIFREEGCLSFPDRLEDTMRYQEVYITNNISQTNRFIATGLLAVVCQHEMDHYNNILLPDRAIRKINTKIDPNAPCICGKIDPILGRIKKYKKCCGKL